MPRGLRSLEEVAWSVDIQRVVRRARAEEAFPEFIARKARQA
jgi:hypothetical protein